MALAWVLAPAAGLAQHEAHQAATPPGSADMAQCAQVQPAVANILDAARARLESARQSNDPAQLRAAVDHLQAALRDLRTQLAPCAAAGAAVDPHAGHSMPQSTDPPADVADPHAGHKTPPAAAAPKEAPKPPAAADPHAGHDRPAAKPAAKPAKPKPQPDPHAGHAPGMPDKPAGKQMDPVTGLMVDPATAPKTTHQGETYYFSSEASKKEFLENPAKFARKPKR
jgi:YHS domain-containing protein